MKHVNATAEMPAQCKHIVKGVADMAKDGRAIKHNKNVQRMNMGKLLEYI